MSSERTADMRAPSVTPPPPRPAPVTLLCVILTKPGALFDHSACGEAPVRWPELTEPWPAGAGPGRVPLFPLDWALLGTAAEAPSP